MTKTKENASRSIRQLLNVLNKEIHRRVKQSKNWGGEIIAKNDAHNDSVEMIARELKRQIDQK